LVLTKGSTIVSPVDNFVTNNSAVTVNYTVDGVAKTKAFTLVQGLNTLTITEADLAGNSSSKSIKGTLDTVAPVIVITSPADGFITNKSSVTVNYTVDGTAKTKAFTLTEGLNTLTITETDLAGNSTTKSVKGTLDTTAPVIVITSPADNFITNKSSVTVNYTVDGVAKTKAFTLVQGLNTLTITETDTVGNSSSKSIKGTLDTTAPVIVITSPSNNFVTNNSSVTVNYTVDGTAKTKAFTLTEGPNTLTITESDLAGNSATKTITGTLDTTAPTVNINPPSNPYITGTTYLITGNKSSDVASVTLEVTPSSIIVGPKSYTSTTWQCQLSNLTEGTINLTAYCSDLAGNSSPAFSSYLVVKTTPPSAPLLTTQIPALTNQPTLTLSGTKDMNSSIWMNSRELGLIQLAPIDRYQLFGCQITLKEGDNHISLFSQDYAGNQSATVTLPVITLDTKPPVAPTVNDLASPTNNPKCLLSGTKEANSSIWVNNQEVIPVNPSTTWSYVLKLSEGSNDITVFSKDSAGNIGPSITKTVVLKTTPPGSPTIDPIVTPTDSASQIITGTKSADTPTIFVECPTASESVVSFPTSTTWACTLTNLTQGKNHILVIAVDSLGNQSEPLEAVIDYAPLVNLTNSASDEINPDIAILNNQIFVLWQDASNSNVYLKSSPDSGATWQPVSGVIGQGYLPKMAVDNVGNIYIVLGGGNTNVKPLNDGGSIYLVKSTDKGATFSAPVNIDVGYNPAITVSHDGSKVYVAWYKREPINNNFTVQCAASNNGGNSFFIPVQVGDMNVDITQTSAVFGLSLATNDDGKYVYCAFPRLYDNFWKIAFTSSSDSGSTFSTAQNMSPDPHNGYSPELTVLTNNIYLIWEHDSFSCHHIWLRVSSDNGQTFSDAARIDDGDLMNTNYKTPSIAVDAKGVIYTTFVNTTNGIDDIYFDTSLDCGRNFGDDLRIDNGPASTSQEMPKIAVNSDGSAYSIVWQDNRSGRYDIYIRNFKTATPIDWLKSQIGTFGFLDSFQDDSQDVARTYDQALAVIAFTAAGDLPSAKKVLDALKAKQNSDGSWCSQYNPKTGDNTDAQNGRYVGTVSWVIAAINFYTQATSDTSYLEMAKSAAEWIYQFQDTNSGSPAYGSLTGGLLGGAAVTWRSTEHNLDAYSAFKHLQQLLDKNGISSQRNYSATADLIREYLLANVWDGQRFLTGYQDDSRYLDPQSLAILSLGMLPDNIDIRSALDWAVDNFSLQMDWNANIKGVSGFDEMVYFGQLPNKIWTEGTEEMVSGWNAIGKTNSANHFHKQVQRLEQTNLGIPYSTLGTSNWPRNNAVSSTCWFYFNSHLPFVNPLDPGTANSYVLTVDDFNDALPNQNSLGFYTGDDHSCATNEDIASSRHIVWSANNSYWYSCLFGGLTANKDVSSYKYLSFKIKSSGANKDFIVRLEDMQNRIDVNINDYVELSGQWQYVNIPITDFVLKGFNASQAKSIAFVFNKDAQGEIWLDDLKFSGQRLAPFVSISVPQNIYCNIPANFLSTGSVDYDGSIVSYEWDFNDGTTSHDINPAHTYLTPGTYIISLQVKDNDGIVSTAQKTITVLAAPLISGNLSFISKQNDDLIYNNAIVTIAATTAAVPGQNLQSKFTIDGQVVQDYGTSASYDWNTQNVSIGKHFVEYDVKDEYNNTARRQTYVYVYRRPIAPPNK